MSLDDDADQHDVGGAVGSSSSTAAAADTELAFPSSTPPPLSVASSSSAGLSRGLSTDNNGAALSGSFLDNYEQMLSATPTSHSNQQRDQQQQQHQYSKGTAVMSPQPPMTTSRLEQFISAHEDQAGELDQLQYVRDNHDDFGNKDTAQDGFGAASTSTSTSASFSPLFLPRVNLGQQSALSSGLPASRLSSMPSSPSWSNSKNLTRTSTPKPAAAFTSTTSSRPISAASSLDAAKERAVASGIMRANNSHPQASSRPHSALASGNSAVNASSARSSKGMATAATAAARASDEVRRERDRRQREEAEKRDRERELREREERERELAEKERKKRASLSSNIMGNLLHHGHQANPSSILPASSTSEAFSISDDLDDRQRYLSDFMSDGSRSMQSLLRNEDGLDSSKAHPLNDASSNAENMDQDGLKLSDSLEKWSTLMKRAVLADFLEAKSELIQRHHRIIARERAAVEGELVRRGEELDASREMLARFENIVTQKDKVIERLASRFSQKRDRMIAQFMFFKWRRKALVVQHEQFVTHVATLHRIKTFSRKVLLAWNSVSRGTWKKSADKHLRLDYERRVKAIEEECQLRVLEAERKLQEARDEIQAHEENRMLMEEEMKRAFMRGVCALNMEAMSIFRSSEGVDLAAAGSDSASLSSAPIVSPPDIHEYPSSAINSGNNSASAAISSTAIANSIRPNWGLRTGLNSSTSGVPGGALSSSSIAIAAPNGPTNGLPANAAVGSGSQKTKGSVSAHDWSLEMQEPHSRRLSTSGGANSKQKSVGFAPIDDETNFATGVPESRRNAPIPQPHPASSLMPSGSANRMTASAGYPPNNIKPVSVTATRHR